MRPDPSLPERIDRYEVVSLLGVGAFAAVYRAVDPALDQHVALKVLGDQQAADPELRDRFVREARLLHRLRDGADGRLVVVHDIGEWNHQPFIVMESFDGGTLADWLSERAPLTHSSPDVRWLIDEIAACLRVLHSRGVAHRNVKPSNFLLRSDARGDTLVLGDFGLAKPHHPTPEGDARADIQAASVLVADAIDAAPAALDARLRRGKSSDPDDRPSDIDRWQVELLDALDHPSRLRFQRLPAVAAVGIALVLVALVVIAVLSS